MAVEVSTSRYIQKVFGLGIKIGRIRWMVIFKDIETTRIRNSFGRWKQWFPILDIEFDVQKTVWRLVWAGHINLGIISIDMLVDALRHI